MCRRGRSGVVLALAAVAAACGEAEKNPADTNQASGGRAASGGAAGLGGNPNSGGRPTSGGSGGSGAADPGNAGLVCNAQGWCWVAPGPIGDVVVDIDGTPDESTVFAVGARGTVVEHSAGTFRYHELGDVALEAVSVVSESDVWVGGEDGIHHLSQGQWSRSDPRETRAIAHTVDGQVWAILDWHLYRREGSAWVDRAPTDPLIDFLFVDIAAGPGDSELWALGCEPIGRYYQCVLEHFDGSSWSRLPGWSPRDYSIPGFVRAGANVYAYNSMGVFLATQEFQVRSMALVDGVAWGAPDDTLFFAGTRGLVRLDQAVASTQVSETLSAIWGNATGDLWLGLRSGGMARVSAADATADAPLGQPLLPAVPWEQAPLGDVPLRLWAEASAAWQSSYRDVWRSTTRRIEHFDGGSWSPTSAGEVVATDIDGSAADDVWFVLQNTGFIAEGIPELLRWDGASFARVSLPATWDGYRVSQLKSFTKNDVFVAAQSETRARIGRFDGADWHTLLEVELAPWHEHWRGLEGRSANELWAVAENGVYAFDGAAFELVFEPDDTLLSIAVDARDVWLLGSSRAYTLAGAAFTSEDYGHDPLSAVELTDDYVWAHSGTRVLRRRR